MGAKSRAAGDSVQIGSLCHQMSIDDDDSDDSGGNLFLQNEGFLQSHYYIYIYIIMNKYFF